MSPDEIARRLREEGMAQAPPDLAPEVMRQVAREPRPRRRSWPRWRPVAAWATAAAAIAAGGFAISQLGGGGSSSSEANSSAASGAAPTRDVLGAAYAPNALRVYTVASRDAARILQLAGVTPAHGSYLALHGKRIVAAVAARKLNQVAAQLAAAERHPGPGPKVRVRLVPRR
ncbi:MAG TPA: hypothetical protein VFW18_06130 [Gaiellales bacterium]|nr:hypothetical protein [Gaiellales bacterium]